MSIKLETLSGQPHCNIYLTEHDTIYEDILKYVIPSLKRPYPEFNSSKYNPYTMYVKTDITLFNKGKKIDFTENISFDKKDSVLQILINYTHICCFENLHYYEDPRENKIHTFTSKNIKDEIMTLIKKRDG